MQTMVSPIPALVLLALILPFPAFAIPAGDILGPALAWFATMVGFASAGFAIMGSWIKRKVDSASPRDQRITFSVFTLGFIVLVCGIGYIAWSQYDAMQKEIAAALDADTKKAQDLINNATFTQPLINIPPPTVDVGTRDLISTRVSSSTKLVPTAILKQVVAEPRWSDRIFVLDVREPEEHEIGYVAATTTDIRYGDLLHDLPNLLPKDRDILVLCWTSKRGEEITTLLRANGFPRAFAIKGGLQGEPIQGIPNGDPGWIDAGLPWHGDDRWSDRFTNFNYVSLPETKRRFDQGATIVDTRDPELFNKFHLPGAINIPIKYMPTSAVSSSIALLNPNRKILIVTCSEYVDCFYGRILGVRLSRLGWTFDEPFRDLELWKRSGYPLQP
jgi:rhodanese-related sulfurtransferase